jgi:hypothetical protein
LLSAYVEDQQQAETSSCRLDGLLNLLHVIRCEGEELFYDEIKNKISTNYLFYNKNIHRVLAEKLNEISTAFTSTT